MRILIIDDNKILNYLLTRFLQKEGYQVENVFDGESAMKRLVTDDFDVVITDYRLPGFSGLDILEKLSEEHMKKIMISAYANSIISEKARMLGARVVEKPFSNEKILEMIV
jgi:DNA-binding response OmpR family regulator